MEKKDYLKLGAASLLIFLILAIVASPLMAQTTAISDVGNSVVRIESRRIDWEDRVDPQGTPSPNDVLRGSGFVVGTEPPFQYIVTSFSNVNPANLPGGARGTTSVEVFIWRSRDDYVPARIHIPLPTTNLAILQLDPNHLLYPYEPLRIGTHNMVGVGEDLYAVGFQLGRVTARPGDSSVTKSIYSSRVTPGNVLHYQMEAGVVIDRGLEGGPVVNSDGHVVGVTVQNVPGTAISGGIMNDELINVLDSRGIAYLKVGEDAGPSESTPAPEPAPAPPPAPKPLEQVATPRFGDDGVLSWNAVSNAQGYEVTLFKDGNVIESGKVGAGTSSVNFSPTIEQYGAGNYAANVKALGGDNYLDGQVSSSSNVVHEKAGISPLMLGLGGGLLLIIILSAVIITSGKKKKPGSASVVAPATQKAPTPAATQASKPATASATRAKSSGPKSSIKGISGQFAGQMIELVDGQLVIGRDPRLAQLVYPQNSEDISRKHLTIRYDEKANKFILEDSSSNGTFLSSKQRLESGKPYYLNPGDRFYVADPKEVFELKLG